MGMALKNPRVVELICSELWVLSLPPSLPLPVLCAHDGDVFSISRGLYHILPARQIGCARVSSILASLPTPPPTTLSQRQRERHHTRNGRKELGTMESSQQKSMINAHVFILLLWLRAWHFLFMFRCCLSCMLSRQHRAEWLGLECSHREMSFIRLFEARIFQAKYPCFLKIVKPTPNRCVILIEPALSGQRFIALRRLFVCPRFLWGTLPLFYSSS